MRAFGFILAVAALGAAGPAPAQEGRFIVRSQDGTTVQLIDPQSCASAADITDLIFDVEIEDEALATFELQVFGGGLLVDGAVETVDGAPVFRITEILTSAAGTC